MEGQDIERNSREITEKMTDFIRRNPTAFHVVDTVRKTLRASGYEELREGSPWPLVPGHGYYVNRNGSSLIAFWVGTDLEEYSFNIAAAHTDSPCFKLKEHAELEVSGHYTRLNTEGYGGMICSTWMDRPLSIAGRVLKKGEVGQVESMLVDLGRNMVLIPSEAIHMNRKVNDGYAFNMQVDMLPLFRGEAKKGALLGLVAKKLGIEEAQILGSDLYVYNRQEPSIWGCDEEFVSSGRLDDQQCVFAILEGLLEAKNSRSINVAAFFDNEEVGSGTGQGADSTFLKDTLRRVSLGLGKSEEDYLRALASSYMISADNAHAVHPNHPEHTDAENCTYINGGVVVKSHAGQKYTSDGMSIALFRELAGEAQVPLQYFSNRSDMAGGSTLGNISMAHVSVKCVDIGLPQLAMHSSYETAGVKDTWYLVRLMSAFYGSHFQEAGCGIMRRSRD